MNREELKRILPHREPMLLVDCAEKCGEGKSVGSYTIKGDEYFLKGHFPGNPVVPGVILCEMASQSSCVILADKVVGKTTLFAGMNNVKFKRPVHIGETVVFECELLRSLANFYFIKAVGKVDGKIAVSGEFSFCLADNDN